MTMSQKKKHLERKEQSGQNAKQWVANEETHFLKTGVKELTKIDGITTFYSLNGTKTNERKGWEQDVIMVLMHLNLKF